MTKFVGIIGYPLKHSISPIFQQAAFDYHRLDLRYEAWETEPTELASVIDRLRHPSILGANVTIPYKEAVLPLLDELDELAFQIGAVNTIVHRERKLVGYNSDSGGFLQALRERGSFEPQGTRVVLLGAGGAARAVGFALVKAKVKALAIVNRTLPRAEALATSLQSISAESQSEVYPVPWQDDKLKEIISSCHLLVNCTSIGMKHSPTETESPLKAGILPGDALVYDLVYNPLETPLLREARKAGARVIGGLAMLVYQGAISFKLWTGEEPPIKIMMEVAKQALVG